MGRQILYGYRVQNGEFQTVPQEALVVNRMFSLYLEGASLSKIVSILNGDGVPYSQENPAWSLTKVANIMKNPRCTGTDGYPVLLDEEVFHTVRERMREKSVVLKRKERPAQKLKNKCRCGNCGTPLHWLVRLHDKETMNFKCNVCGIQISIPDTTFLTEIEKQAVQHEENCQSGEFCVPYTPSGEVIRSTNAINRGLENPEQPEDVIALILESISARYDCFPSETLQADFHRLIQEKNFQQVIAYITITADNTVTVVFKQ